MTSKKVFLQHVTREDVERINQWLSDDTVTEFLVNLISETYLEVWKC